MSLTDRILNRRSIRHYKKKEIPEEVLNQIFEAGRNAPSAANMQPIHFIILKNNEVKKKLSSIFSRFLKDAPVVIVGCANVKAILTGKWAVVDTTIAMQNMAIAAWALGVGSCWIGSFNENKVKKTLNIPDNWKVVALITLGYPAEQPKQRKKKPLEKMFSYNSF
ncbi:MAG: nitroreductase family protein [Candidatus Bathyarchaeota archaeon]|nr:nitroreductase family protein [Candidatus Bathyarchaeota archaeon]